MSKRLTASAIVATLLMAATSFYSSAEHSQRETSSRTVLIGG
jgi:hypothetical protein